MEIKLSVKRRNLISLILIFFSFFILTSCASITGGPVSSDIKSKINQTITENFKKSGFTGQITHVSARHNGFSQGGIAASYTYSENIHGKTVKIVDSWDFDDEGEDYDSEEDAVTAVVPQIVLKNPKYIAFTKKYLMLVYRNFKKMDTATLKVTRKNGIGEIGFGKDVQVENSWLIAYAKNNKNREFNGYYNISAEDLFRNKAIYFSLPFHYNYSPDSFRKDSRIQRANVTRAAQQAVVKELKTVDFSKFPDGTYNVSWDIRKVQSKDNDFVVCVGNQISFTVRSGQNISIGKWE